MSTQSTLPHCIRAGSNCSLQHRATQRKKKKRTPHLYFSSLLNRSNSQRCCATRLKQKNYKTVYVSDTLCCLGKKMHLFHSLSTYNVLLQLQVIHCIKFALSSWPVEPSHSIATLYIFTMQLYPCPTFVPSLQIINSMCKIRQYNQRSSYIFDCEMQHT